MRGWRSESYRHSLAARGIKTSLVSKFTNQQLLVHRQNEELLQKAQNDYVSNIQDRLNAWLETIQLDRQNVYYDDVFYVEMQDGEKIPFIIGRDEVEEYYIGVMPGEETTYVKLDEEGLSEFLAFYSDDIIGIEREMKSE